MNTMARSIVNYITAKDHNRPHLMPLAFSADATLSMSVNTDSISFPAITEGREQIIDVLVRRFNQTYENIYTFCLATPLTTASHFTCNWLVVMTEKDSRNVRVGFGKYDWQFETQTSLVKQLAITIESMKILDSSYSDKILPWVANLSYPWCEVNEVIKTAPKIAILDDLINYLNQSKF